MALIDLDKFVASFITEIKKNHMVITYNIPSWIKKALEDQGLEYEGGEIVKSQRRVSAEFKESGYGEPEDERIRKAIHIYLDWLDGRNKDYQPKGDYSIKDMIAWLETQGKQKPAIWSEEDERMYNIVFEEYKNRQYYSHPTLEDYNISGQILGWLKSLKDRVIPQQKSAWSEEDEERFQSCLNILQVQAKGFMGITETINTKWLKSLKNRIKEE